MNVKQIEYLVLFKSNLQIFLELYATMNLKKVNFLVTSWEDDANANIIKDLEICASCGDQYFSFKTEGKNVRKEEISLNSLHEKAIQRCCSTLSPFIHQMQLS